MRKIDYFVDIQTLYSNESERTVEKLASLYDNSEYLKMKIAEVLKKHLNSEMICNKKILLKPNWVKHSTKDTDGICLRTNDNFILATLEIVLIYKPLSVTIGDAPIQGCNWDKILNPLFLYKIEMLRQKYNADIKIQDFRRVTFDPSKNNPEKNRNLLSEYKIFDLGNDSYLEPISQNDKNIFRVTNYNPDRLAESHTKGMHKYCITKVLFDSDLIISLPKVKTHQKAGLTAALKNLVGLNGDKDYLPHHRIGGTGFGGDCYPGKSRIRLWSELALDFSNRRQGKLIYWLGSCLSGLLWKLSFPKPVHQLSAGWFGNDTTWRMVLDLNKIAMFGKADGTISNTPQRLIYSLCDGVIGGQGDGPLKPDPLPLGIISFTNHSGMNDVIMGQLMGFDVTKIPLLNYFFKNYRYKEIILYLNNSIVKLSDFKKNEVQTTPPPGWTEHLKNIRR